MKCQGKGVKIRDEKLMVWSERGQMFTPLHTAPEGFYGSRLTCLPDKTRQVDQRDRIHTISTVTLKTLQKKNDCRAFIIVFCY